MKRRLEICRKCDGLRRVSHKAGNWYCHCDALVDNNGEEVGVSWNDIYWSANWKNAEVPRECDFYAEYFLEECNDRADM